MNLLLSAGLILVFGIWITLPLVRPSAEQLAPVAEELNRLLEMKQAVYRSILDLEFDLKVGKVSREDHDLLRRRHEAEAVQIIRQLDAIDGTEVTDLIEREIAEARKRL
jgi:hypothetical protein